jgi:hypothetical protein
MSALFRRNLIAGLLAAPLALQGGAGFALDQVRPKSTSRKASIFKS